MTIGEDKAFETFCALRWADTDGEPVCPRCGALGAYAITTRRKFKCSACYHQFSPTSGTIFASRKMAYVDLLSAIKLLAGGTPALAAARMLNVQYRTTYALAHKVRQVLAA